MNIFKQLGIDLTILYQICDRLIAIDLSKQVELENPDLKQQINFIGKLEHDEVTMFFNIEKSEETTFKFLKNSANIM